jgi:hypothetical protein
MEVKPCVINAQIDTAASAAVAATAAAAAATDAVLFFVFFFLRCYPRKLAGPLQLFALYWVECVLIVFVVISEVEFVGLGMLISKERG